MPFKGQNFKVISKKFDKVNLQQCNNQRVGILIVNIDFIL